MNGDGLRQPAPTRLQIAVIFAVLGVLAVLIRTLILWASHGGSFWAALGSGVLFGVSFTPPLFIALRSLGRYAPRGQTSHSCEVCGESLPILRRPRTLRQAFRGGWTCPGCGAELDRRGAPIRTR